MRCTLFPFKEYSKSSMRQATSCAQVSFAILISQNTMFKWLIKTPPFSAAPICFSSSRIMWRRGCQFYSTLLNNSPAFLMLRHTNKVTWTVALSCSLTPPSFEASSYLCHGRSVHARFSFGNAFPLSITFFKINLQD